MEKSLKNKIIIVTGGASGIGFEIANKYLSKEAKLVIILDVNESGGTKAVETLSSKHGKERAVFIKCDLTTDLEVVAKNILGNYKIIDVIVNNAAVFEETSVERTIKINTIAVMNWSMKFWEHMRKDKGGKGGTIINVSSIFGHYIYPFTPIYTASKYAVTGFSKSLGHKDMYNITGVRIIVLCPGVTGGTNIGDGGEEWEWRKELGRYCERRHVQQTAEDVANGAVDIFEKANSGSVWICSDRKPAIEVKEDREINTFV